MNFARNLVKQLNDDATNIMEDGLNISETSGTIDTGSHILNAALSKDLFGGVQDNKITAFAGEEATGKTYFALALAWAFQQQNPDGVVLYYDSEASVTKDMMAERGLDISRIIISEKATVQDFKVHLLKTLDLYMKDDKRPRLLCVLDSLGQLASTKEMADAKEGKEVVDMTKAKVIRSAFRVLQLELARAKVPLIVTNHTYINVGSFISQSEMGGGSGLKYAASTICYLTKAKERDGTDVTGAIVTVTIKKSRFTRENKKIKVRISYDKGLDRYYGLIELSEKYGLIKKVGNKWSFPDNNPAFEKEIYKNPEKYFTPRFLEVLNKYADQEFRYGAPDEEIQSDLCGSALEL